MNMRICLYKNNSQWEQYMIKLIVGVVIGAAAGFAYYKFIGCSSGACPLTSNPVISTIYGAVMGALLSGFFHNA
jgi:putative effector of murein hydrolase